MSTNEAAVEEATDSRTEDTEVPDRLSAVTGKPQYSDYVYVGTDSEGTHHYYSDLTSGVKVLEGGELVWHEPYAELDDWVAHIHDERGWTTIDRDGLAGSSPVAAPASEDADT